MLVLPSNFLLLADAPRTSRHKRQNSAQKKEETPMTNILLIDNDPTTIKPLKDLLTQKGYQLLVAHNGREGLRIALDRKPDLVLLELAIPEIDGWSVCRTLRAQSRVPILILTKLREEVHRILGLELGADHYLTKPISMSELIARIRAMLRRVRLDRRPIQKHSLRMDPFDVDLSARRAFKHGQELQLRHKEFELLSFLMSKEGQVVTRGDLFDQIWGFNYLNDTRSLDVHICWLRQKIEQNPSKPRYIQTVRGVGYRFASPLT
ncbi:MAG: response regulator transcription factor [Ardenticatenaceae bacterium]